MDFQGALDRFVNFFTGFQWFYVFPIIALIFVIFYVLRTLAANKASTTIWSYVIITVLSGIIFFFLNGDIAKIAVLIVQAIYVVCVTSIFATEIKRDIWNSSFSSGKSDATVADSNVCIEEIVKAVQNMSKNNIGAIIILSNGNLPSGVLESGVQINADISSKLIESIFFPKTALHDGALVLKGTKIQAAGCFLPLAQEVNLSRDLGSRHRAGIGLTETVNVTAIIVSEETGIISIAKGGKIIRYIDTTVLRETLKNFYWQEQI
ncbi:MAG: DNA integrity scanning protein DisA nucleotide-binding domain protein [Clostridia bacterium]|nr:DNA integrity scanning protein DisA nucleotide-binding domain protein [Clostridia bacterium]